MTANSSDTGKEGPDSQGGAGRGASRAVREAFDALPFEQKISTLLQIQLDLLGNAADTIISATSKAVNDISEAFKAPECQTSETTSAGDPTPNA